MAPDPCSGAGEVAADHIQRPDGLVKGIGVHLASGYGGFTQRCTVRNRLLGDVRCVLIAYNRRQCRHQHHADVHILHNLLLVQLRASKGASRETASVLRPDLFEGRNIRR